MALACSRSDESRAKVRRLNRVNLRAWITLGDAKRERVDLQGLHGAELFISGGRPRAELRFDGVGLGQMAARSLTLRRGAAVARLVISAYGRIRRE